MATNLNMLARSKLLLQKDGFGAFLKRALTFPLRRLPKFEFEKYYLYEHHIIERADTNYLPRIKDFSFHIITSNQQAKEMARAGLDIYTSDRFAKYRLHKGAIAFCIFTGNKLCHIGWVGHNEEAKNSFDHIPYRVNFPQEACTGGTLTIPEFEGQGLMTYGYYKRFEYLRQKGIYRSRNVVERSNAASQKVHEKFSPWKSKGYYLRIGRWQFWREASL